MITNVAGSKATFRFFKVIGELKLVPKKRIDVRWWRAIRDMVNARIYS